jgi:hypothetical protein
MKRRLPLLAAFLLLLTGCTRLYYASMEKIGKEKRDILVQRILDGRKDQEQAKKQFQTTLEAFQALTGFDGGDLEKTYHRLDGEFKDAESRARKVHERIESIDKVANDLFREWNSEIEKMGSTSLRSQSRGMLRDTEQRYQVLIEKMRATGKRMEPVLGRFRDQVLFLKHNLNSRAIRSLKKTSLEIDRDVSVLVKDLEASIQEADRFIESMAKPAQD